MKLNRSNKSKISKNGNVFKEYSDCSILYLHSYLYLFLFLLLYLVKGVLNYINVYFGGEIKC
jgi:hypothetical protein